MSRRVSVCILYTACMSSVASSQGTGTARRGGRVRRFWDRISEGQSVNELWRQFTAEARHSYGFYGKDVDWERAGKSRGLRRAWRIARELFWAMLQKLSPVRRVVLLAAFVLLCLSSVKFAYRGAVFEFNFDVLAALMFLLVLSLELADKVTMKRDLEIAREIQTWLVPTEPPQVPGAEIAFATRPQNSVAGDYYDAFYPDGGASLNGELFLIIADVAGKSVPAALLMATLQASLRTIAGQGAPLAEVVTRLNHYACAHSLDGLRFTTAVLAQYNPASRALKYVNAGHNAPVLRRAGGRIERLDTGGLPLGIAASATHEIAEVQLASGDVLVLYTDGVVEAVSESGQEYSEGRWLDTVRAMPAATAQDTLRYLMASVDSFAGAARQFDDITCMVFRSL